MIVAVEGNRSVFSVKRINGFNEETLRDILFVNRFSFPEGWQSENAGKYYRRMLQLSVNIGIILKYDGKMVGFLMAIPHNDAIEELRNDDPKMKEDRDRYYIETVGILPAYAGRGGFSRMLDKLLEAAKAKEMKLSLHARVTNGFNEKIRAKLAVSTIRRIEKWKYYNFSEATDYIEGTFGMKQFST